MKKYSVYKHTNLTTGKVYIGVTNKTPEVRWGDGDNYASNKEFYKDILKYGWFDGFLHEVLKRGLNYNDSLVEECKNIIKFDSVNNGYNKYYCMKLSLLDEDTLSEIEQLKKQRVIPEHSTNLNNNSNPLGKYKIFNDSKPIEIKPLTHFCKIPNQFIRCSIQSEYGVSRIFYVVYFLIDKYRSIDDFSWIFVKKVYEICGYKKTSRKSKVFYQIVDCLKFLKDNGMIFIKNDLESITYDTGIEIKIIPENFDATKNFSKLYSSTFDKIVGVGSEIAKENILLTYLYINSYIGGIKANKRSENCENESISNSKYPKAFFRDINSMSREISMSKETIFKCIDYFLSENILIKEVVGSVKKEGKPPQNVPNIYVINKQGYEKEIEWALEKMKEIYKVEEFNNQTKIKGENKKIK